MLNGLLFFLGLTVALESDASNVAGFVTAKRCKQAFGAMPREAAAGANVVFRQPMANGILNMTPTGADCKLKTFKKEAPSSDPY